MKVVYLSLIKYKENPAILWKHYYDLHLWKLQHCQDQPLSHHCTSPNRNKASVIHMKMQQKINRAFWSSDAITSDCEVHNVELPYEITSLLYECFQPFWGCYITILARIRIAGLRWFIRFTVSWMCKEVPKSASEPQNQVQVAVPPSSKNVD